MSIKRILAAAAASVVAVSAMAVVASADGFSSSVTISDSTWWTEHIVVDETTGSISDLIGDVDPANIASITFSSDIDFQVGYNNTEGSWTQKETASEQVCDDIDFSEERAALKFGISKGDGVEYTINWTVNLKDGGDAAPADSNNNTGANNVDTGVEGVAAVLGVAAVAAGAMIVAKKRK